MASASSRRCADPATSAPAASTSAQSMTWLESTIWPCSRVDPGGTSSSPVDTTATRGRGCTDSSATLAAAASARWPGPSRVPAGSTRSPVRTSSPRRRSERPGSGASVQRHLGGAAVGELDRHDGVGALGHRGAGHDPQRVADRQHVARRVAGGDVTGDRQHDRRLAAWPRRARPRARRTRPWPSCRSRAGRRRPRRRARAPARAPTRRARSSAGSGATSDEHRGAVLGDACASHLALRGGRRRGWCARHRSPARHRCTRRRRRRSRRPRPAGSSSRGSRAPRAGSAPRSRSTRA